MTTEVQVKGLGEFADQGFTVEHSDDHILLLKHEGEMVARFSQTGATNESLQAECADHLVTEHGWDACLCRREEEIGNG